MVVTFARMNLKAILAIVLVTVPAFICYKLVDYYSKDAVQMPRKYNYDRVEMVTKRGKQVPDTVWHRVKSIPWTNQFGQQVSLDDLRGKIIVMDFFFTRCPSICPGMTKAMKRLQASFVKNPDIVQFVSVSIDPERDSVASLRAFADRFGVNHDSWWFVTGSKNEIYDFAMKEMLANVADPGVDTAFIHTENLFLLDTNRVLRGFYNAFDTTALAKLARDIPTVMLEKDRKRPSIFRAYIPYLPVIFIGIACTFLVVILLKQKKNKHASTNA